MSSRKKFDFDKLASKENLNKTVNSLKAKGYKVHLAKNGNETLNIIKRLIPGGVSVMNGSSVTLEQIGYKEYLNSGNHGWIDLYAKVNSENDPVVRSKLRNQAVFSEYYVGSVHALTEGGDFIVASNTGSQLPHIVYTSANLIFVVSTKKIVPDLDFSMKRLEDYVFPLEEKHMQKLYKVGSNISKIVIFKKEAAFLKRKIHFILVTENLGF